MRVGLLVYGLDRPLTGIGRHTLELIRALATLPNTPELVLLTAGGSGRLESLNLPETRLPGCRLLPGLITLGNIHLARLAPKLKLDIIHDFSGMSPFLFPLGRTKTLVSVYDVIPWSYPGVSSRWDTLVYRNWLPRILRHVDGVVTISEASRVDIARFMNIPIERIGNVQAGVSPMYQPAPPHQIEDVRKRYNLPERYILYVGSVEERKNLRGVLKAFSQLQDQAHQLVIVGPKQWKYTGILETLEQMQLGERVIFTGYVQDADLNAIYSGADLFVFPSFYEGFGLPVIEAMACGTPVITSNVSSLPEAAGDAALQVNPDDTDELASAMRLVLEDASLRETMRQKGLAHVQAFSWEKAGSKLLGIYEQILAV